MAGDIPVGTPEAGTCSKSRDPGYIITNDELRITNFVFLRWFVGDLIWFENCGLNLSVVNTVNKVIKVNIYYVISRANKANKVRNQK